MRGAVISEPILIKFVMIKIWILELILNSRLGMAAILKFQTVRGMSL
jgi:hypothetical protein